MTTTPPTGDSSSAAFPARVRHGLDAGARVRCARDYTQVFERGRRTAEPLLVLHWLARDTAARLGLAVSRKVSKRAVARNRIKRVLRESFRRLRHQLPPGDYVFVARAAAAHASNDALRTAQRGLLQRAGALPPPALTGTMPPPSTDPHAA